MKVQDISNFWRKRSLWKNVYSAVFSNRRFHSLERLVFYIKREKSFFQDLLSRCITWGYKGLQGVLKSYKGIQVFQSREHSFNCHFLALSMMSLKVLIFTKWKTVGAFCKILPSCQKRIDRRARLLLCVHCWRILSLSIRYPFYIVVPKNVVSICNTLAVL